MTREMSLVRVDGKAVHLGATRPLSGSYLLFTV